MKNSDKIPSPLADKLDAFEFPFDETAWASFEALRPADKPKPKTPYRFLGFGLMLLGLAVALFFYNKKNVAAVNGTSKGPLSISAQKSDKGASMLTFEEKTKVNEVKIFDVQNSIAKNALLKMDTAHHLFPKDGDAVVLNTNYSDKKPFEQHLVTETAQKALVTNAEANIKQQKESNPIANATSNQKNQKDVIANATSNQENQKESTSVNTASLSLVAPTTPTDISNETSRTTAIPQIGRASCRERV